MFGLDLSIEAFAVVLLASMFGTGTSAAMGAKGEDKENELQAGDVGGPFVTPSLQEPEAAAAPTSVPIAVPEPTAAPVGPTADDGDEDKKYWGKLALRSDEWRKEMLQQIWTRSTSCRP